MGLWHRYVRFLKLIIRWVLSLEDAAGMFGAAFACAVIASPIVIVPVAVGMIFGIEGAAGSYPIPLGWTLAILLFILLLLPALFPAWQIANESLLRTLGITRLLGASGHRIRTRLGHWSRKVD